MQSHISEDAAADSSHIAEQVFQMLA